MPLIDPSASPLDRARTKAYLRLIPILFACYVIAYVDRTNVSIAKLTMSKDMPAFNNDVIGTGAGIFFLGYFLLEVPGTLLVEMWSARKWISRIMISWGIVAALTAFVHHRVGGLTDAIEAIGRAGAVFIRYVKWPLPVLIPAALGLTALFAFLHFGLAKKRNEEAAEPGADRDRLTRLGFKVALAVALLSLFFKLAPDLDAIEGEEAPFVFQFFAIRFLLGLAEAGFFPGVIVYLTHWFPARDRTKALAWFLIATPIAQMISPKICNLMLRIGSIECLTKAPDGSVLSNFLPLGSAVPEIIAKNPVISSVVHPPVGGLLGWQWIYIAWGIPAVILGFIVLMFLTDRPGQARWLADDEREALENELAAEKARARAKGHMSLAEALGNPKVLLLCAAYFFIVTGNYGIEIFLPSILEKWYNPGYDLLTWILMLPPLGSLAGQLFIGWNSDRTKERRLHAAVPILMGAIALGVTVVARWGDRSLLPLSAMVLVFTVAATGLKAYLPAFWSLPSLFLTEAAAAGSIGLINSVGNLGGYVGPKVLGYVETQTGSFKYGILFLSISMCCSAAIILLLGLGKKDPAAGGGGKPLAEPVSELA
ncbi:MAG: MFS transporter [Isosphaeraceae bacterium]